MRKLLRCLPAIALCLASLPSFAQCLSGTYRVGPGQNYTTLTAAVADYNNKCLGGPVVFELTAASYTTAENFPIQINVNADASATKTLTIRPAAGITTTITGAAAAIIKLNGADYVTIDGSNNGTTSRNLTLQNMKDDTGPGAWTGVWVGSLGPGAGATHNTIKNCIVRMNGRGYGEDPAYNFRTFYAIFAGSTTQLPVANGASGGGKGADNDQLTIQNNLALRASHGIYVAGDASAPDDDLLVTRNTIGDAVYDTNSISVTGIHLFYCNGANITDNLVQNVNIHRYGTCNGMILDTGFVASSVRNNRIIKVSQFPIPAANGGGGCGLYIRTANPASNLIVYNNMISGMDGEGTSGNTFFLSGKGIIGLHISGTSGGVKIYHNSIFLNLGSAVGGWYGGSWSMAVYAAPNVTNIDLRNNILMNNLQPYTGLDVKTYALFSSAPASAFTNIDYNDYYVTGPQTILARLGNTDLTTLAALQASFGGNQHSVNAAPVFVDLNDLHLQTSGNAAIHNKGIPIAGITQDIDYDNRSTTAPDIGADEITGACTTPVITTQPTAQATCVSASATFTVAAYGPGITYQWRKAGVNIAGATSASYSIAAASLTDAGSYDVVITNSCGNVTSSAVQLTVYPIPTTPGISADGSTTFCSGNVRLNSSASTGNQWFRDGVAIANAIEPYYFATQSGSYTVRSTVNNCASAMSAPMVVSAGQTPVTPTITRVVDTLFSSVASGNQWYKDGVAISGATQAKYTINASGSYTVQVTNGGCASAMSAPFVTVITAVGSLPDGRFFTLLPNPVTSKLTIRYTGSSSVFRCVLFDMTGKKLGEYGPFSSSCAIDMNRFGAGTYILDIVDIRKNKTEHRTVVKK